MRLSSVLLVGSGLLVSGLFVASSAFAHGDSPSLEAEDAGYLIDIGHEPLAPGTDIEFDVDLFTADPIEYADFASAFIRVTRNGTEIVSGAVKNDGEHVPVFTVNFPDPGGYDIDVRYLNTDDSLIVARTFHVDVPHSSNVMLRDGFVMLHYAIATGLFALSIGIAGYSLWQRFGKRA